MLLTPNVWILKIKSISLPFFENLLCLPSLWSVKPTWHIFEPRTHNTQVSCRHPIQPQEILWTSLSFTYFLSSKSHPCLSVISWLFNSNFNLASGLGDLFIQNVGVPTMCPALFVHLEQNHQKPVGFPWWRSGWESTCQCREHGFEPWSGKIPHTAEQLGP